LRKRASGSILAIVLEPDLARVVRRNTFVLAAATALNYAVVLLGASLAAITAAELTGDAALAGVAPSIFLVGTAFSAFVSGRLMDRLGRVPVMAAAFILGAGGALVVYLSIELRLPLGFFAGVAAVGITNGAVALGRAAAADMYPAERRGRGIGFVLGGAAVGVVGGALLFGSLLGGSHGDLATLAAPWPIAAVLMTAGAVVVRSIRVDPLVIGRRVSPAAVPGPSAADGGASRDLASIFAPLAMRAALGAIIVAQLVMTVAMSLLPVRMQAQQHDLGTVSLAISSHLIGMFLLSPILGPLSDRIGRGRALVAGLALLGAAVLTLNVGDSALTLLPAMFLVGVGWNVAYVAASAAIADGALPQERGRALGAADLAGLLIAATGATIAGVMLARVGFGLLVASAAVIALLPTVPLWRLRDGLVDVPATALSRGS
jgi:MFS family permease